ncbi:DNA-binding winged helix-turn-helix (wHTH) protein [Rhizobium mongolense]|uniref:DNA-binding winged helix-turn-helix (WHTH) protein n=1 Tax=Rhizobium mongolense TaxID=57676 RepID=A0A7W6RLH0_9HYPH|nr:DNA-binding winged helix-turn-helix (wHTH) protein [Rhizobium mongolense]
MECKSDVEDDTIRFGRFRAIPHSRQLLLDDQPREIGGRAFDLLMVLLKSNGAIVSKDDILNEVWPSMVGKRCCPNTLIRLRRTPISPFARQSEH